VWMWSYPPHLKIRRREGKQTWGGGEGGGGAINMPSEALTSLFSPERRAAMFFVFCENSKLSLTKHRLATVQYILY
jgi:hypothetical protein